MAAVAQLARALQVCGSGEGAGRYLRSYFREELRTVRRFSILPLLPFAIGILALVIGAAVMAALLIFGRNPGGAAVDKEEKPIHVAVAAAQPGDVPVLITGFGEAAVLKEIRVAPEVSGKITHVHPYLVAGGIIPEGAEVLRIDTRPFQARVADTRALAAQQESARGQLEAQWENERERLRTLERSNTLAKAQFERAKQLSKEGIGSASEVDRAEQTHLSTRDEVEQLTRALKLYPFRVAEAQSALESAKARLAMAEMDLANCRITAPFAARVKSVSVEKGQFVTVGRDILTLADDSVLEISVPLNSIDARRWLRFSSDPVAPGTAWFTKLASVPCTIRWTEEDDGHTWQGVLHRVEAFDQDSRTLTVAVRIEGAQALSKETGQFPLVEGMFCEVRIPGRTMRGVYRLEPGIVSLDSTVFLAVDSRLKTVTVEIARRQDGFAFVSSGLDPGDLLVTTRLVNPLENSLLEIAPPAEGAAP